MLQARGLANPCGVLREVGAASEGFWTFSEVDSFWAMVFKYRFVPNPASVHFHGSVRAMELLARCMVTCTQASECQVVEGKL